MWRRWLRGAALAAYFIAIAGVFVLSAYVAFSGFVRSGVTTVPELRGLPERDASILLVDQGLAARRDPERDRYDEQVVPGHVLDQRPRAGSLVKRGSAVEIVLSRGPLQVLVPDLTGQAIQAAQVTLAAAGLPLGRSLSVYSDAQAPGLVVLQDPPAGTRVERANPVTIFLSLDNPGAVWVMPDLVYRGYDAVRGFLTARGFRLGSVKFEPYEGIAPGVVLRQYPLAGHPLRQRDTIALVVAAEPVAAP
jgi:serine/threonine-protein kinase